MNKHIIPLLVISLLCAGCGSSPPVQFYMLETLPPGKPALQAQAQQQTIGVGPISAPSMLENKKIVTRLPDNVVEISDFQQWASPLPDNVMVVLSQNLTALQPGHLFRTYPWSAHGTVDKQIIVDIIRFDATPGVSVNLEANWSFRNEQSHALIKQGRSVLALPLTGTSYPDIVHGMSQVLQQFSRELAMALMQPDSSNP